jgi:DNA invertase Pin-like site-specific DNA recombinase
MLVVWRLDRLGRSLSHLIELIQTLEGHGVGFKSLTEQIDTTTSGGKLIFHIFGALAEFERNLIRERTMAGLQAVQSPWTQGGGPEAEYRHQDRHGQAAARRSEQLDRRYLQDPRRVPRHPIGTFL